MINFISDRAFKDAFKAGKIAKPNARHVKTPRGMNDAAALCWSQGYREGFSATHDAPAPSANIWSLAVMDN